MRMYDGAVVPMPPMLPALFDEAIAPVRILGDHDERTVLEAALALEVTAEEMKMLVLGRNAHALLGLDLGVKTARADAEVHWRTWLGEQLPRVLRDEDPAFADVFGAETVTVGATRNAHSVGLFSHTSGPPCRKSSPTPQKRPSWRSDHPKNASNAALGPPSRRPGAPPGPAGCSPDSRKRPRPAGLPGSRRPSAAAAHPPPRDG